MEAPPTPSDGAGESGPSSGDDHLTRRLADVEIRLDQIGDRLDRLEASLLEAVARQVEGGMEGMRRAVTELGRRLVQDLPHELARHREAIKAELRPLPPPPAPQPPHPEEPQQAADADLEDDPPGPADSAVATAPDGPTESRRRRPSRPRRRRG